MADCHIFNPHTVVSVCSRADEGFKSQPKHIIAVFVVRSEAQAHLLVASGGRVSSLS